MKSWIKIIPLGLLFACSSLNQNLSQEEITQLEVHVAEVEEKIEGSTSVPFKDSRPWEKTDFSNQTALGYDVNTFATPEPLKPRVQFWIDIFSKYSTSQGVLHDSRFVDIVYEAIDFTHLDTDKNLTGRQRFKAEKKIVDDRKDEIEAILLKLSKTSDTKELTEQELKIWKMFEHVDEENKFFNAAQKGRLRFQLGLKDRMLQGIYHSGRYIQQMEKIFSDNGMPKELTRLPFVESSFNINARSKVGASGIWQFMRSTGKSLMKVNPQVDERNDPITATYAAAKFLKRNYDMLQSWPLAVTAYNYGAQGLKRIVDKNGTTDLFDLYGKKHGSRFGFATESFYASFLAALEVERNADKYFGKNAVWAPEFKFDEVRVTKSFYVKDAIEVFGSSIESAKLYNPHLNRAILQSSARVPEGVKIKIPPGQASAFEIFVNNQKKQPQRDVSQGSNLATNYTVTSGDTLYEISKQFQVSVDKILEHNQDLNPRALRPGQVIEIPH